MLHEIATANIRYISGGRDAPPQRFTAPTKPVTPDTTAVSNAARNIPSPLAGTIKRTLHS